MQTHSPGSAVAWPDSLTERSTRTPGPPTLREWLAEAPFALGMSSGFFGFFAHCGALTALEEAGLSPMRVSGSSAGALVAGAWASGVDAADIANALRELRRQDFWDPRPGLGLLRGRLFARELESLLRAASFSACRVPLTVSAFDGLRWRTRVLDDGPLAPAIRASCAVPFLFQPVWLDGRPHWDGGVSDRPGLCGVPNGTRLLFHHLASRSPWRRRQSPSMKIPERDGMTALVIDGLPRVGPFALERGQTAFRAALAATRRALDHRITNAVVRLTAE